MKLAEQKRAELNSATAEKWKELQQGMSKAIDHLKQSLQKSQKESA